MAQALVSIEPNPVLTKSDAINMVCRNNLMFISTLIGVAERDPVQFFLGAESFAGRGPAWPSCVPQSTQHV
jgi:hypothetical protein